MKKTLIIFSIVFGSSLSVFSQDAFPDLKKIKVDESVYVYYQTSMCRVMNEVVPNEANIREVNVLVARLIPASLDSFLVTYNEGPSADPCFIIYRVDKDTTKMLSYAIDGLSLFIPGNGFLYVSGHTDNMYDTHRKFKVTRDTLLEVTQPFYYVGLKSVTIKEIEIYSDTTLSNSVAILPKGSNVEIVLNKSGNYYLLKTPFGLLGWAKIDGTGYGDSAIKGLFFAGD